MAWLDLPDDVLYYIIPDYLDHLDLANYLIALKEPQFLAQLGYLSPLKPDQLLVRAIQRGWLLATVWLFQQVKPPPHQPLIALALQGEKPTQLASWLLTTNLDPTANNYQAVYLAALTGNVAVLKLILLKLPIVTGLTYIKLAQAAIDGGCEEVVTYLLTYNLAMGPNLLQAALDLALTNRGLLLYRHLLTLTKPNGQVLIKHLWLAIKADQPALVVSLLAQPTLPLADYQSLTLNQAISLARLEILALLLADPRINPNQPDLLINLIRLPLEVVPALPLAVRLPTKSEPGPSPMVRLGRVDVVKVLLSRPSLDLTEVGPSAISLAAQLNDWLTVKLLVTDPRLQDQLVELADQAVISRDEALLAYLLLEGLLPPIVRPHYHWLYLQLLANR